MNTEDMVKDVAALLLGRVNAPEGAINDAAREIVTMIRAADAARIAELEAALAPFADAAKYAHLVPADESSFPDSYPIGGEWIALDVGDLRRVVAVMEPKP